MKAKPAPLKLTDFEKPEDILAVVKDDRIRSLLSTILMGDSELASGIRPEWAIRALTEFWKSCQDFPRTKQAQSEIYRFSFMWGVLSRLPTPKVLETEPVLCALMSPDAITPLFHAELAKLPASEAAEAYSGFAEGIKQGTLSPSSRCLIYLLFAILWQQFSQLKNVTEIHSWLQTILGPNRTGTRDRIAKICQDIGLRPPDKGGRPKAKPRNVPKS